MSLINTLKSFVKDPKYLDRNNITQLEKEIRVSDHVKVYSPKIKKEKNIITIADMHPRTSISKKEIELLSLTCYEIGADYIILLGDMSTYHQLFNGKDSNHYLYFKYFLQSLSETGKQVIYIPGNKEFSPIDPSTSYEEIIYLYKRLCDSTGVIFLHNTHHVLDKDTNLFAFSQSTESYFDEKNNSELKKEELLSFLQKIKTYLTSDYFNILALHSHIHMQEIKSELLDLINLILSAHTHNGLVLDMLDNFIDSNRTLYGVNGFFSKNERGIIYNPDQQLIINRGLTKLSPEYTPFISGFNNVFYTPEITHIELLTEKKKL